MSLRGLAAAAGALLALVAGRTDGVLAGSMSGGHGHGGYVNIVVREVKVAPVRAHVGDPITVEMIVEDRGDLYYANVTAEILANGRVVASELVTYGLGGEGGRIRREKLVWNTTGAKPGAYRIEGQLFVWGDASPFDNSLAVGEPVILVPPGAPFPGGRKGGGVAVARDPRFKPTGESAAGGGAVPGGY